MISEFARRKVEEIRQGRQLTSQEIDQLNLIHKGADPSTMLLFNSKINQERIMKWHPELDQEAVDRWETDIQNLLWLDPSEYGGLMFID